MRLVSAYVGAAGIQDFAGGSPQTSLEQPPSVEWVRRKPQTCRHHRVFSPVPHPAATFQVSEVLTILNIIDSEKS